jgi:hypothetical protein
MMTTHAREAPGITLRQERATSRRRSARAHFQHGLVSAHGGEHDRLDRRLTKETLRRLERRFPVRENLHLVDQSHDAGACRYVLASAFRVGQAGDTISGVTGFPSGAPLSALTSSGRWTCSASRVFPKTSAPTTGMTTVVSTGIAGSCSAGALKGRMREPSASFRRHPRGHHARNRPNMSSQTPPAVPVAASVAPMTSRWRCVSSAAQTLSNVASVAATCAGASAICAAKMRVVVVVSACSPFSCC